MNLQVGYKLKVLSFGYGRQVPGVELRGSLGVPREGFRAQGDQGRREKVRA